MKSIAQLARATSAIAIAFTCLASLPRAASSQALSAPERKRMEEMLRGVRKEIAENYYDSTMGGLNLNAVYDSAAARLSTAQALDGGLSSIAWLTLELHDSHTFFIPPQRTVAVEYGWEMTMVGDTCFVIRVRKDSDAEMHGVRPGDQIISINGYAPTRENLWQIQYLFWILRPQRDLRVVLRSPGATPRELDLGSKIRERSKIVDLTGADGGAGIGRLVRDGERASEEYRPLSIDYGNYVSIFKLPTFEVPIEEIRDALNRARGKKALVVDLRGNGGGYEKVLLDFLGRVSRDSVVVGTVRGRKKTLPLVAKGTGKDAFAGDLIVLIDSRSASASEMFARAVQLSGRGKVLGDRSAGAVMRAEFHTLRLGMETVVAYGVEVTVADVVMSDGGHLERVGVSPDELLLPSSEDLAEGNDVVMARALTLAGMPTDAHKAGSIYPKVDR